MRAFLVVAVLVVALPARADEPTNGAPLDAWDAVAEDAVEEAEGEPAPPACPADVAPPAPGMPPATAAQARAMHDAALDTPTPTAWEPAGAMGCIRRGRLRGFCQGPRRIPESTQEQLAAARALGLGTDAVGHRLVIQAPEARWVEAARGPDDAQPQPSDLMFPVESAALWRGYGMTHRTVRGRHGRRAVLHHAHMGVDLGAPEGTYVRAANDGIVAYSGNASRGYGNLVEIVHPDASVTFYAHMRAAYVVAGVHVARGQIVGEVGDTGFARGKHLHFEWHVAGAARNPLPHFAGLPANITPGPGQLDERIVAPDASVTHSRHERRHGPAPRHRAAAAPGNRSRQTP